MVDADFDIDMFIDGSDRPIGVGIRDKVGNIVIQLPIANYTPERWAVIVETIRGLLALCADAEIEIIRDDTESN